MPVNEQPDNSNTPKRGYHSPKRRNQADATRRRIVVAAARLFAERGFSTVTMEMIASEAGISLATVYLHFSGRAAVVGALAEEIVTAPELSVEWVVQEADPVEQVRIGAHAMRQLNERAWLITDILRSQQGNDPELERLWLLWRQRHLDAMRRAVEAIASRGVLQSRLSVEAAADVLYALTGTEVYRALVSERGWKPDRYERWLFEVACQELLTLLP
ncbi:MAG TPA: helix-turn-helix domain-containing protein [Ktedonobacterales bacterium]